jgi:DNA-directed RNA polymerase specialized sigma24 family protein
MGSGAADVTGHPDEATEGMVLALYPALRRFAAMTAPLEMDPDDLVQDALAATLASHALTELDDPMAYLRVAMVRLASNERRRLSRKRRAGQRIGVDPEAEAAAYPSDLAELDRLSPEDRALLYLTAVEGHSIADVARMFKRSTASMKMRRHRALRQLRTILEEERHG